MENKQLSILMIGAHPDDCELKAGGTAALWARLGHCVQFVAMTGGDNGHPSMSGGALQQRRREEAREAAKVLGIARAEVLENHGGELLATLEARRDVVRLIREARADIVISHRSTDYHPDHRYTATLVQDAAYMVTVPFFLASVPALERNPVFLYFEDTFTRPVPFRPDIAVKIDEVFEQKMAALEAHASQMFEWLPFMMSRSLGRPEHVPEDPVERRAWLAKAWFPDAPPQEVQACLQRLYPAGKAAARHAEAFEICEYGSPLDPEDFRRIFPFLPAAAE
ncbi:MAG: PIG-L deacetylase family protein [Acidobacteriota bacterium]|jgi:LmbE family N-acetylglucosaminyl deacetylase